MFGMLLWKEWKENFWKLLFCGAASVVFTIMLFRIRIIPDYSNCILISFIQAHSRYKKKSPPKKSSGQAPAVSTVESQNEDEVMENAGA